MNMDNITVNGEPLNNFIKRLERCESQEEWSKEIDYFKKAIKSQSRGVRYDNAPKGVISKKIISSDEDIFIFLMEKNNLDPSMLTKWEFQEVWNNFVTFRSHKITKNHLILRRIRKILNKSHFTDEEALIGLFVYYLYKRIKK